MNFKDIAQTIARLKAIPYCPFIVAHNERDVCSVIKKMYPSDMIIKNDGSAQMISSIKIYYADWVPEGKILLISDKDVQNCLEKYFQQEQQLALELFKQ